MNGEQLALLRSKLGLSQKSFAQKIGMSESAVAMVEANHREMSKLMRGRIADRVPITDELLLFFDSIEKMDGIFHKTIIS